MLIFDDCFNYLKNIEDNSIDLILTDPPYNISKKSGFKNGKSKKFKAMDNNFGEWDTNIELPHLLNEYYRVLKSGGTLLIFYDIWKCQELKKIALDNNFKQPRICQWIKTNPTPVNSKRNYLSNSSEHFFTFVKDGLPTFNSTYDNGVYHYPLCHGKERLKHPTQKPLKLIKNLIEKHSNENDLVLDTFSGVGTTAIACLELSRKYIMIENNRQYFEIQEKRVNDFLNIYSNETIT